MTESTVSSPFMTKLRQILIGSVVVKHHDGSMIGLPDCSVNWLKKTCWLEFKLVSLKETGGLDTIVQVGNKSRKTILRGIAPSGQEICQAVAKDSPVQFETMKKLDQQAWRSYYVVWIRKAGRILLWQPSQPRLEREFNTGLDLALFLAHKMTFSE